MITDVSSGSCALDIICAQHTLPKFCYSLEKASFRKCSALRPASA